VVLVTLLLVVGVSESARVNNFIVFVKLSVLVLFIGIGVFYINLDNWDPFIPPQLTDEHGNPLSGKFGVSGIMAAASWIFFAYVGFEAVSTAAAEAKDPQKDMPFGILGSLLVCTVIYMLVSSVLTGVVHYSRLDVPDPLAVAANEIGISWFKYAVKVGAIMGLSSVMLVLLYGQTRIFYIMSRDGLLPRVFSTVHPRYHTPYINTLLVGAAVAVAAGTVSLDALGNLVNLGTLLAFSLVCFSVLRLHYTHPALERPFSTPGKPFTPVIGIACCFYLIYFLPPDTFRAIGIYLVIGMAIYFLYGQFHSHLAHGEKPGSGDPVFVKAEHDPQVD
jgi:APA family basic amino acid/polyamine antiporter